MDKAFGPRLTRFEFVRACGFILFPGFLAACQGDTGSLSSGGNVPGTGTDTILSRYFVESFTPYEGTALSLLLAPKYARQHINWFLDLNANGSYDAGEPDYTTYPLASSGAHYAHAVGLTGQGQRIAIADAGFRTTHEAFLGKSLYLPSGPLPQYDHGTFVASVAAGNSGSMIGIAPGAELVLGSYGTFDDLVDLTDRATALGAVAFNNSWGIPNTPATRTNYDLFVVDPGGSAWLDSLRTYTEQGVVVFAVSNDAAATRSGLLEALPKFAPELEQGWLAVANGVATVSQGDVVAGELISAGCLDTAPWCIVAEGSWEGATASSDASYDFATGTSFAAPMVAGALALLAEAFPDLPASALRARLLASADNSFAGFTAAGTVEIVPGFSHAFSNEFGHGFLDIKAALLPIGPTTLSLPGGKAIPLDRPLAIEGRGSGNAVRRALADRVVRYTDTLGTPFDIFASSLVASPSTPALGREMMENWASNAHEPAKLNDFFAARGEIGFRAGSIDLSVAPARGSADGRAHMPTFSFGQTRDFGPGALSWRLAVGEDERGYLPGWSAEHPARLTMMTAQYVADTERGLNVKASFSVGTAAGSSLSGGASRALLTAASASISRRDLAIHGDRLAFTLSLPAAVIRGATTLSLPVVRQSGSVALENLRIPLVPEKREMRLSIRYDRPLAYPFPNASVTFTLGHAFHRGNIAGQEDTAALIGIKARF